MRLFGRIDMIFFDILTLIILVWMVISGICKGLIVQLGSLVGIALGIALAIGYGEDLGLMFNIGPQLAPVAGFLIIFVVTLIITLVVAKILSKIFEKVGLGWANKIFGVFFAIIKGMVVLGMFYAAIFALNDYFKVIEPQRFDKSASFNIVRKVAQPLLKTWQASRSQEFSSQTELPEA